MNYSADTDMDLNWAADQLRRKENIRTGLHDTPVRRVTAALRQSPATNTMISDPSVSQDMTLGNALSALAIHARSGNNCHRICETVLALVSDRDRLALHAEVVRLKGVDSVLSIVKHHEDTKAALVALRILDKLSRTSARDVCSAGGVDVLIHCCDRAYPAPRMLEAALRVLLGLSFDNESKMLLLRRGVRGLAEVWLERLSDPVGRPRFVPSDGPAPSEEEEALVWQDVQAVTTRLVHRLNDGQKGYTNRFGDNAPPKALT